MNTTANNYSRWEQQVIALAGISQSAALVQRLATTGTMSGTAAVASINSLLVLNPDSFAEVYPDLNHFSLGLQSVQSIFSTERARLHAELVRLTLGLMLVRNKLVGHSEMQEQIRSALATVTPLELNTQSAEDGFTLSEMESSTERTFEQIAKIYQDTISTLPYRIQVQGKIEHLKNEQIANRIRALLLAGIRSAVLWHQLGGRRWRLLFHRKRVQESAAIIRRKLIVTV